MSPWSLGVMGRVLGFIPSVIGTHRKRGDMN